MRKQASLVIMVALIAAVVGATVGSTQATPPNRQAWEYTMAEWRSIRAPGLARLGDQGWELVAVTVEAGVGPTTDTWYYFKRAK